MELNSICYLVAGGIGFIIGYIFRGIAEWCDRNNGEICGDKTDDIYDRVIEREAAGMEAELEKTILDWTIEEYPGYSVEMIENEPGIKLLTIYDVDDSEVNGVGRRLWEIIDACEKDYNINRRLKFTYIPNVHTHMNTLRFFKQYLREKTGNV